MIKINLLPVPKARQSEALIYQSLIGLVVIALVVVGCYFVGASKQTEIDRINGDISKVNREIEDLKAKVGEVEKFKKKLKSLEEQLGVIRRLQSGRTGPVRMLDEFTDLVPRKLWIQTFKESGGNLTIQGESSSGPDIADFLDRIKKAKYFENPELKTVQSSDSGDAATHKFSITMKVKYTF